MHSSDQETDIEALYRAVGYTVVSWALIEQALDFCIEVVFHCCGGEKINAEIPRALKAKLRFMRKSLRQLEPLQPVKDRGLALMDETSALKPQRDNIVHAAVKGVKSASGIFEFSKLHAKQTTHYVEDVEFDLTRFPEFSREIERLETHMLGFAQTLVEDFAE